MKTTYPYQILDLKDNWIVTHNQFYNFQPKGDFSDVDWDLLNENMLVLENINNNLYIITGWYPEKNPNGIYKIKVYWGGDQSEMILESFSKIKDDIVDRLNWLMEFYN